MNYYTYAGMDMSMSPVPSPDSIKRERFCPDPECACSQSATGEVPCWQCGGATTPDRPKWWPYTGCGQTVVGGHIQTAAEIAAEENAA